MNLANPYLEEPQKYEPDLVEYIRKALASRGLKPWAIQFVADARYPDSPKRFAVAVRLKGAPGYFCEWDESTSWYDVLVSIESWLKNLEKGNG